ncbi:Glucose 1-dehydrogenase [Morella rubra]|uniref:Glucose 1-dehydrogenase n=1 Tax=Morella rubra TaxID=262757 RepID=A0A6A1WAA1_9ROSI|nr:Glucose 1-dehydrogenase [Morella rubra]
MAKEVSEPWGKLEGKVVMVTGASSGLGLDFCLDLAKAGCKIVAAARRLDRLNSLCHQINLLASPDPESALASEPRCPRAVAVELDVCADASTIEQSVRTAWDAFGHIDALINNAGIRGNVKSPLELSEEEWNRVFKTNLTGTWLVSKYVCIRMRDARQGGSIINISSIAGLDRGQLPGAVAYASSKAGLNTMSKVMAMELGVYKIRVNSISPGLFRSEITQGTQFRRTRSALRLGRTKGRQGRSTGVPPINPKEDPLKSEDGFLTGWIPTGLNCWGVMVRSPYHADQHSRFKFLSVSGLGGCPYARGASGDVATEDVGRGVCLSAPGPPIRFKGRGYLEQSHSQCLQTMRNWL